MQRHFTEKRKKRSSYAVPIIYFLLEIILMWLVIGLFNWNLDVRKWNIFSYEALALWLAYSSFKFYLVIKRQKISRD